ncbi:MAG: hypothetical protein CMF69_00295 [Magnetovibrio sp.]|nr:hypothetical protein [Magnetovibrio sp.]
MSVINIQNATWIDEVGIKIGLPRFRDEDVAFYRKRILSFLNNPVESNQQGFIDNQHYPLPIKEKEMFEISLKEYEADGFRWLQAEDPRVEIASCFLRVWSNYSKGGEPDLELLLSDRENGYFVEDVYNALSSLDFIEVKKLSRDGDWEFLRSENLKYSNSLGYMSGELLQGNQMTKLSRRYIEDIFFENDTAYFEEVESFDLLQWNLPQLGQYYVDKVEGIVWSTKNGRESCSYSYRKFPMTIYWQPIKSVPINDKSIDYLFKDNLINKDGREERLLLNSYGARIVNEILAFHSLQWGK